MRKKDLEFQFQFRDKHLKGNWEIETDPEEIKMIAEMQSVFEIRQLYVLPIDADIINKADAIYQIEKYFHPDEYPILIKMIKQLH